jgi:hypothetical protein
MTALGITAVGVASGKGIVGVPALAAIARWPNAPPTGDTAPDSRELMAVRRRTGMRYLDPLVERGVRAIEAAKDEEQPAVPEGDDVEAALRTGILMVTRFGPSSTREQLYKSMGERQGKGVSATLFSSCGYNIASAVMAKVRGIRGVSLTFAAAPSWSTRLLRFAEGLFARRVVDRLFLSYADGNAAIVLRAEPWEAVEQRAPARALHVMVGLESARGKGALAIGPEPELARAGEAGGPAGRDWRRVPLRLEDGSPGLAFDPTFLSIAWLWETQVANRPARLAVAVADGVAVAFDPSESAGAFAHQGATP